MSNPVYVGQMEEAMALGIDPVEVGWFGSDFVKSAVKVVSAPAKAMAKVMQNPVVSTITGPVTLPIRLGVATVKGGPKGALNVAKAEIRNPVLRHGIKAAALVYPPAAPAAVAIELANRALDAAESNDPAVKAKGVAQIAATMAVSELGGAEGAGALKALDVLKKAKALRSHLKHRVTSATPSLAARPLVCGAQSSEARGVWLKTHVTKRDGKLCATVYTVAGGKAEVFRFEVNLPAIERSLQSSATVSGLFDNLKKTAEKVGRGQLLAQAQSVIPRVAARAKCAAQVPTSAVSDQALALYAGARKGVESIDRYKTVTGALNGSKSRLKKLIEVKAALAKMTPQQKAEALKRPEIRKAIVDGIVAKTTLAEFVKSGGIVKTKKLGVLAKKASNQFAGISKALKSGDPKTRLEAQKVARAVTIATKSRSKIKSAAVNHRGGLPGIMVSPTGKLIRGKFKRRTPRQGERADVMLTKLGRQTGVFEKIAGDESILEDPFQNDVGCACNF
jgi:hypothetical protein